MIADPEDRGRALAELFLEVGPRLHAQLAEAGVLPGPDDAALAQRARDEWDCFALYACVRGLVAAGGFNRETAAAIDALHERVLSAWRATSATSEAFESLRGRIAERYAEYGAIGQAGGSAGAATVARRLGEAAARHMTQRDAPPADLAELAGDLHESLAESAAESVRQAGERSRKGSGPSDRGIGSMISPPRRLLISLVERLEGSGIVCALGGSGLLAALGLADQVRDWDLTTDAPIEQVMTALTGESFETKGSDALHADRKLMFGGGEVELILGFAFQTEAGVVRIPTRVSTRRDGVPLGSPEGWAVAYHLLGRAAKCEALLAYLDAQGADAVAVARLLEEPLPPPLAARLKSLPTSRGT